MDEGAGETDEEAGEGVKREERAGKERQGRRGRGRREERGGEREEGADGAGMAGEKGGGGGKREERKQKKGEKRNDFVVTIYTKQTLPQYIITKYHIALLTIRHNILLDVILTESNRLTISFLMPHCMVCF